MQVEERFIWGKKQKNFTSWVILIIIISESKLYPELTEVSF